MTPKPRDNGAREAAMGKFTGMLLVSDYDNTFQYTEAALSGSGADTAPPPSGRNIAAAAHWTAEGGLFAIATGRALGAVCRQISTLPINAPIIVDNGGSMYDLAEKRYVLRTLLPDCALEDLAGLEAAFPGTSMELYLSDERIHVLHPTGRNILHCRLTGMPFAEVDGLNEKTIPVPLSKVLFMAETTRLLKLRAYMTAHGWEEKYEMIFSSGHLLELTAKGADKGAMARRLKRLTNSRTLICIGDHANDLPMLRSADRAFAPANAIEDVRAAPGVTVVCHCLDGAVADAVERLEA